MKQYLKSVIPSEIWQILHKIKNYRYGWKGDYSSWEEAQDNAVGYDNEDILHAVKASLLKVKNGEAAYERDSVIFDEVQYSWPLLAGLMFSAAKERGTLSVLDFGGSLGSTYFQNKFFLDKLEDVSWNIVEQKHFVDAGKELFEDKRLQFFYSVDACLERETPNTLLFSGVLQYIENPYDLLNEILMHAFRYIIIDRTPFSQNKERITLQVVPTNIYKASYPCRFFDENEIIEYFKNKGYEILEQFDALDGQSSSYKFKGILMERSTH